MAFNSPVRGHVVVALRQLRKGRCKQFGRAVAGDANADQLVACIGDLDLGSQHKHAQALQDLFQFFTG